MRYSGLIAAFALLSAAAAQEPADSAQKNICQAAAPWNRQDSFDHRADDIRPASDWAEPALYSGHPAGKLAGVWNFELKGLPQGESVATAGRLLFSQEGEGYSCEGGCGYKPAKADAKWLAGGQRWGHENYGLRTPDNPEDIPPGVITLSSDGSFNFPQPQYYPFPELSGRFDPQSPDSFSGSWTLKQADRTKTGKAIFTRAKPKIIGAKYFSTIEVEAYPGKTGCVALDYDAQGWGPGNDMRGNRPGFNIEIYGENFFWFAIEKYKIWIDPDTKLEIDSGGPAPIFERDENGKPTDKVIGLRVHVNIWPGSKWGPKTIYVDGQPVVFDYYVKPVYEFTLNPARFQLVEGHYPEKPQAGRPTHIGFRLVNLPDHAAKNTALTISFVDAKSFKPAGAVKIFDNACHELSAGAVQCQFDETRFSNLEESEFTVAMPDGGLRWFADWTTEGVPDPSLRSGKIDADDSPQIVYAFSLSNQTGAFRPQTKDFLFPYPNSGAVSQKREIILFGKNLDPDANGAPFHIESMDPTISYLPRTGAVYSDRYAAAWSELSKRYSVPIETLKEKFEILLLEARLNGAVMPGKKSLKLNGQLASWKLRFGGLKAEIQFVRENDPYEDNEDDADDDVLTSAYVPERIYVRVKTSSTLPVGSLPMTLYLKQSVRDPAMRAAGVVAATISKIPFTATKTSQGYYYSPPIRLIDKGNARLSPPPQTGDIPVNIFLNGTGADMLSAEINSKFARKSFAMPILPAGGELPVSRSPGRHRSVRDPNQESDYLFKSALAEAAQCHKDVEIDFLGYAHLKDMQVDDWDKLSESEAKRFYSLVLLTFDDDHLRTTTVTFGHHAAMLLMRKMFIELLNEQMTRNTETFQSELTLKGFLDAMRLELGNERFPINRVKVTAPDGSRVEYGDSALSEDLDELARRFNSTPEEIARWRLTATVEAIAQIDAAASEAAEEARQIDKCDIKGLLKLTGSGFSAVSYMLKPRLMRLVENTDGKGVTRLYWEPDDAAREWTDNLADTAARYDAQRKAAEADNQGLMLAFALVTAPAFMIGSTPLILSVTAADVTMLGADAVSGWIKSYQSHVEIDFSRDAAVVIGFERNDEAVRNAYTWMNAYWRTVFDLGFATVAVMGASEQIAAGLMRSDGVVAEGRAAVQELAPQASLRTLGETEQRDLQLFAMRARARELALGAEALDAVERRAITAIEEDFRAARTEFIHNADASNPLGYGEKVALPFPFDLNEAQVRFLPAEIGAPPPPGSGKYVLPAWELEEPVMMARMQDDVATDVFRAAEQSGTEILRGGGLAEDYIGTEILRGSRLEDEIGTDIIRGGETGAGARSVSTEEEREWQQILSQTQTDKALHIANRELVIPSEITKGAPFPIQLGRFRGGGLYAVAIERAPPFAKFQTLLKMEFGMPDRAAVAGKSYLTSVHSEHFVLPEESLRLEVPINAPGRLRGFSKMYLVEDLGQTLDKAIANEALSGTELADMLSSLKGSLDDLNDAGIVMVDYKLNNIAVAKRGSAVKTGFFDYGAFIRAKGGDAALAREMQNFISGPPEEAVRILQKYNRLDLNVDMSISTRRRDAFRALYRDKVDDIESLGVSRLDDFDFNPSGSEGLPSDFNAKFTAEKR